MPLKVNINAVPSYIMLGAKSKNNILVIGEPGVGKSSVIGGMEKDGECKVTMLTGSSTYEETVNGIPYRDGKDQHYTMPDWFKEMWDWADENPNGVNILFIDEFNTADEQVIKTFLSILTEHKIPTQKQPLPPNTCIVAAMNPQDQNNGAEFIRPLASRFIVLEVKSTMEDYEKYMTGDTEAAKSQTVEVREKPAEMTEAEIKGLIQQISPADWQRWEYNQVHEICPRSMSNYLRGCQYLVNVERDCGKLAQAMLGFNAVWQTAVEKKAEQRAKKVKNGQIFLSRTELEAMPAEQVTEYMESLKSGSTLSPKMLETVSICMEVIAKKGA